MPSGRVDGLGEWEEHDQVSMTQKYLNTAPKLGRSDEGRNRRDPQVKNALASDSVEKATQSHGMWTARNKVSALSPTGWSTESLMKRIFKRI